MRHSDIVKVLQEMSSHPEKGFFRLECKILSMAVGLFACKGKPSSETVLTFYSGKPASTQSINERTTVATNDTNTTAWKKGGDVTTPAATHRYDPIGTPHGPPMNLCNWKELLQTKSGYPR